MPSGSLKHISGCYSMVYKPSTYEFLLPHPLPPPHCWSLLNTASLGLPLGLYTCCPLPGFSSPVLQKILFVCLFNPQLKCHFFRSDHLSEVFVHNQDSHQIGTSFVGAIITTIATMFFCVLVCCLA